MRKVFELQGKTAKDARGWDFEHTAEVYDDSHQLPDELDCTLIVSMRQKDSSYVNPILDWSSADVFGYLAERGVELNPLYKMGYSRVGCVMCPFAGKVARQREAADFPQYRRAYVAAFDRMIRERRRRGKKVTWATGEEVMHWWLDDGVIPNQMQIRFEEE